MGLQLVNIVLLNSLLTTVDLWTKSLEDGCAVDVIYFNLAKAFDSVHYTYLLTKLESWFNRKSFGLVKELPSW